MMKNKKTIILFFLIICLLGCAKAQPDIQDYSNVIEVRDYGIINSIEPVVIKITQDEIKEEAKYNLIKYSEIESIGDASIAYGNIVYILVTLYDDKKNKLVEYQDAEYDFIAGEYEFDHIIEDFVIGKKIGEGMGIVNVKGTMFEDVEGAAYFEMKIKDAECYIYPQLDESFLKENFNVSTETEFYKKIKEEVESIEYELELNRVEEELVEKLIRDSVFNEQFSQKVEERYKDLIEEYKKYGKLYDMTVDEVLDSFDMDRDEVRRNAQKFQGEWELALYFLNRNEIRVTSEELESKKQKYAKGSGYDSVDKMVHDNGEQYLLEQIYTKELKDYLYEKYVGEIKEYEN